MSRSSTKSNGKRLSRIKVRRRENLRGMDAREYYAHSRMTKGIVAKLRSYISRSLWTKLDRGKPVTRSQAIEIERALGKMAVESEGWPYSWPAVTVSGRRVPGSKWPAIGLQSVKVEKIPRVSTPDGIAYVPTREHTVSANGRDGIVGFSSHAIDQWIGLADNQWAGRSHGTIRDVAIYLGLPELVLHMLARAVEDGVTDTGAHGPCLTVRHNKIVIGYLPLAESEIDSRPAWICKTYLKPGMRGVPAAEEDECDCESCCTIPAELIRYAS